MTTTAIRVRSPSRVLRLWAVGLVLVVGALLAPTGAAAGYAHSDPPPASLTNNDVVFLKTLDYYGITYTSPASAITAGYAVCTELGSGKTPNQVAYDVWVNTHLDATHAGEFVGASIGAFCYEFASEIGT